MKYILSLLILLLTSTAFAQSKKELRAQLLAQQATIDSLQQQLVHKQRDLDTLTRDYLKIQRGYNREMEINQGLATEYNLLQKRVWTLEEENRKLREAQQPTTKSSKTSKPKVEATTRNDDNPFGGPGSGGGRGDGKAGEGASPGRGDHFGTDNAPFGSGGAVNDSVAKNRFLIKQPNASEIVSDEDCRITFIVMVDENGNVIGTPSVVTSKTTTTDTALIQKVAALIKKEAKYNKCSGSEITKISITVNVRAK